MKQKRGAEEPTAVGNVSWWSISCGKRCFFVFVQVDRLDFLFHLSSYLYHVVMLILFSRLYHTVSSCIKAVVRDNWEGNSEGFGSKQAGYGAFRRKTKDGW